MSDEQLPGRIDSVSLEFGDPSGWTPRPDARTGSPIESETAFEMSGGPGELTGRDYAAAAENRAALLSRRNDAGRCDLERGGLLREAKERRLYKASEPSWDAFVVATTEFGVRRADQLIGYARLHDEWNPGFHFPPTEHHGRALLGLTRDERVEVLAQLKVEAGWEGVTWRDVDAAVDAFVVARDAESKGGDGEDAGSGEDDRGRSGDGGETTSGTALDVIVAGGVATLEGSKILEDLDEISRRTKRIAKLGPHAIPTAMQALSLQDAWKRLRSVWDATRVLVRCVWALGRRFPEGSPDGQESFAVAEDDVIANLVLTLEEAPDYVEPAQENES